MKIIKQAVVLDAYRLGDGTPMERDLTAAGKLLRQADGTFLVFSRETDTQGQVAQAGDYIKIDSAGFPYPNSRAYFEARHIHLGGTRYRQIVTPLEAWTIREPVSEEIAFLTAQGLLRMDPTDDTHYFRAHLWGAELFAAKDAVIVFDHVARDMTGRITRVDFHFLAWAEFLVTHRVVE